MIGEAGPDRGRRALLRLMAGAGAALAVPSAWSAPVTHGAPSCVVMDWGLAATVIALGVVPKGIPAPGWYDRYVVAPACPEGVVNVGLLFTPNFELVEALAPDLIVITPALMQARALFERIAPVLPVALYVPEPDPYARAVARTRLLAERLGRAYGAAALEAQADAAFAKARSALEGRAPRPVLLVSLVDERHVRVFGRDSLFQSVLDRLGLVNAGAQMVPRGLMAVKGLEAFAGLGEVDVVHIDPPSAPDIAVRVAQTRLWQALPFVREGHFSRIPPVLPTAGLPAAARFADLLGPALGQARAHG